MSDCSTEAMKPKAPPKTCGTCARGGCIYSPPHSVQEFSCHRWIPGTDFLEQRYQQLEQVAKDMYRYMDGVLNKNWAYSLPDDTDAYKEALEALGVSLDD